MQERLEPVREPIQDPAISASRRLETRPHPQIWPSEHSRALVVEERLQHVVHVVVSQRKRGGQILNQAALEVLDRQ
jgi:hypothetical protein